MQARNHIDTSVISLIQKLLPTSAQSAEDQSQSIAYLQAFSQFLDNLPELPQALYAYQEQIKALIAANAGEDDPRWNALESSRKALESIGKSMEDTSASFAQLHAKYPEKSKTMEILFQELHRLKRGDDLNKQIGIIANIFKFSRDKLLRFFTENHSKPVSDNCAIERHENILIAAINTKLKISENAQLSQSAENDNQQYLQKIKEMSLTYPPVYLHQKIDKNTLKIYLSMIDSHYQKKTPEQILAWAKTHKGQLDKTNIETICAFIGIMERANELATLNKKGVGFRLHDTQKIAILIYLLHSGHVSQIYTGEGKTVVISFVQALKVFQGYKGHIITSNALLAEQSVKDREIFYALLTISVEHNNPLEDPIKLKTCYTKDVVYGCISNFQFDWLKHSFEQLATMEETDFANTWVMLDEIDSLLIDQGANIAKLSGPFPGMESLQYVYIHIWIALHQAEKEIGQQLVETLQSSGAYPAFDYALNGDYFDVIRNKINAKTFNTAVIPPHLHPYLTRNWDQWIMQAFIAKFHYTEDVEYTILRKDDEATIIPIDNENTGVALTNTILSKGLHQFLQLKHNLTLTYENLTSSYISNLNYIKRYNNKLLGATGTLGSTAECDLLHSVFELTFSQIPRHADQFFTKFPGKVVDDAVFIQDIAYLALGETVRSHPNLRQKMPRAVLIICVSKKDVIALHAEMHRLSADLNLKPLIIMHIDETTAACIPKIVHRNTIIIATNIASRGTDFKISRKLEKNGGLHVIQAFLACNRRVEFQADGRASRQGDKGSAQMVIRSSELLSLGLNKNESGDDNFDIILKKRDECEGSRLLTILEKRIPEMEFKDELFNHFCKLHGDLKKAHKHDDDPHYVYALMDLKECWAFWLDAQNYTFDTIKKLSGSDYKQQAEFAFGQFIQEAQGIIITHAHTTSLGKIHHNPYYSVCLAERYLEEYTPKSRIKAKNALLHALNLSQNSLLLYPAHQKLFEVTIENGGQLYNRYMEAVNQLFLTSAFTTEGDESAYKKDALHHLKNAKEAIGIEYHYLGALLGIEIEDVQSTTLLPMNSILISPASNVVQNSTPAVNYFMKNLHARYICLMVYLGNIDSLMAQIEGPNALKNAIILGTKIPRYLATLDPLNEEQKHLQSVITQREVNNFEFIGMSSIMQLQEMYPVYPEVIAGAQIQLALAASLFAAGLCYPPLLGVLGQFAGIIIAEALTDIVLALINQGEEGFNAKEYIKAKVISYGISLGTMAIGAALKSTKILGKAVRECQKLVLRLQKVSGPFAEVCEKAAKVLGKFENYLVIMIEKINFARISQPKQVNLLTTLHQVATSDAQISQMYGLYKTMQSMQTSAMTITAITRHAIMSTAKSVSASLFMEKVVFKSLFYSMDANKPLLEKQVKVELNALHTALSQAYSKDQINASLVLLFETDLAEDILQVVVAISLGILRHAHHWKVQLVGLWADTMQTAFQIGRFTKGTYYAFLDLLSSNYDNPNPATDTYTHEEFIQLLSPLIAERLYNHIVAFISKTVTHLPAIAYKGYQAQQTKMANQQAISQIGNNIVTVNNADITANCTLEAIAEIYNIDIHDAMHAFGFVNTSKGVSLNECKNAFTHNGMKILPCEFDNLHSTMESAGSDRALVFFMRKDGLGHSTVYFKQNDPDFINNYRMNGDYTSVTFIVPVGLSKDTLADNQYILKKNRLRLCVHPLIFSGMDGDPAFGVEQTITRQLAIISGEVELRDPPKVTRNAIHGSGNDELMQSAYYTLWVNYGLRMEFFLFRIPTEQVIWVITVKNQQLIAGHSGALRRTEKLTAFITKGQERFHKERNNVLMALINSPEFRNHPHSCKLLAATLAYTIENTAGEIVIMQALSHNPYLFNGVTATNGDLMDKTNAENFIIKNQIARDLFKCIVARADELSGNQRPRVFSANRSHAHPFFQHQNNKINQASMEELGRIAMTPVPYQARM